MGIIKKEVYKFFEDNERAFRTRSKYIFYNMNDDKYIDKICQKQNNALKKLKSRLNEQDNKDLEYIIDLGVDIALFYMAFFYAHGVRDYTLFDGIIETKK